MNLYSVTSVKIDSLPANTKISAPEWRNLTLAVHERVDSRIDSLPTNTVGINLFVDGQSAISPFLGGWKFLNAKNLFTLHMALFTICRSLLTECWNSFTVHVALFTICRSLLTECWNSFYSAYGSFHIFTICRSLLTECWNSFYSAYGSFHNMQVSYDRMQKFLLQCMWLFSKLCGSFLTKCRYSFYGAYGSFHSA